MDSPGRGPGVCFSQLTECTALWALLLGPHSPGAGTHLDLGLGDRAQSASWAAHPSSYLAGVLFALSEASTQHVFFDGFQLEAGLSIFAIEYVALVRVNDGHGEFLQDSRVGQAL